jgi:signal peptidase I
MTETSPASPQGDATTPRRSWVAVVLTLVLPGLGHLYVGAPRRALFIYLMSLLGGAMAVAALTILSATALPILLSMASAILVPGVFFYTLAARDAVLEARRAGSNYVLRRYNRWYVYAALVLVIALVVPPRYARLFHSLLQAYQIPNSSMEPTLYAGDYLLARPLRRAPSRGQLVIFQRHNGAWTKRIVGTPGDTLAMEAGVLSVNGHPMSEPSAFRAHEHSLFDADFLWQRQFLTRTVDTTAYHPTSTSWGPVVVPPGQYFVLGDNRGESADSRYFGFVAADSIVQQPTVVYFSRDRETHSVRWGRIGIRLSPP